MAFLVMEWSGHGLASFQDAEIEGTTNTLSFGYLGIGRGMGRVTAQDRGPLHANSRMNDVVTVVW